VVGAGAHIPQPSKRRPFREQRTVNPLIVHAGEPRVRSFSTISRPALRAAACGGRPRPAGPLSVLTAVSAASNLLQRLNNGSNHTPPFKLLNYLRMIKRYPESNYVWHNAPMLEALTLGQFYNVT
jgi:hypothetical protein